MRLRLLRLFDVRDGEARQAIQAFAILFLLITAYTVLETARDALFLTKLPPQQLNLVYIALAGLSFVAAAGSTRLAMRFGRRNALIVTVCVVASTLTLLYAITPTPRVVMGLYVFTGLAGGALVPQFWLLAARLFTSAQGRRLYGSIASGGAVGGAAGAGAAALLLRWYPVTSLLLVSALVFVAAALLLTTLDPRPATSGDGNRSRPDLSAQAEAPPSLAHSKQPFVWRVALLVALSTAAVLTIDYLFKSTVARTIPAAKLGTFLAGYYASLNGLSVLVQLLVASRLVRRLGVAGASGVTPTLLLLGGAATMLAGGAMLPVLALRLADGGLRNSLHRVSLELLYLPMPTAVRERAKSLIDTVLSRSVQAVTAGPLFVLGTVGVLSPRLLAAIVVALTAAWLVVAVGLRLPYLQLFRAALARGTLQPDDRGGELDVDGAEALVEAMASPEPTLVIASLNFLEQRKREKLVPALILYHDAEAVLFRALEIFTASSRTDWIPLGERLLSHPSPPVRVAAVRALGRRGVASAVARAADDVSPMVQGYATYHLALHEWDGELAAHARLAAIIHAPGEPADAGRRVLLTAVADTPDPRAASLVLAIAESQALRRSERNINEVARAMEALHDPRYVPFCIAQLAHRPGRDAIQRAMVAMGEAALDALEAALVDPSTDRRVRLHLPWTVAEFASQRACDILVERLEPENDGRTRFKVLRALGHVVATSKVKVDRAQFESRARRALVEHLRIGAFELAVGAADAPADALGLLLSILASKQAQALARAFRLLKIAHPQEDIHRVPFEPAAPSSSRSRRHRGRSGTPGKNRFWRMFLNVAWLSCRARRMPSRWPPRRVTPALSIATSVPVLIAMPTFACASAGASQPCDRGDSVLLDRVCHRDETRGLSVDGHEDHGLAFLATAGGAGIERRAVGRAAHHRVRFDLHDLASHLGPDRRL